MSSKLDSLCIYVKEKTAVSELNTQNYISTENMIPDKGGIVAASSLPSVQYTQKYLKNDVLVSNIRPYFKKIWQAEYDGGCSNDVLVFRANSNCDPTFLYYVLANDLFFDYATATSKGTKMPRGDKTAIMQYEVPNFKLDIQVRIGKLLRGLDERIATNKKINDNLEQQAIAIFQQELLIEGDLPEGWTRSNLLDIANYLNGLAMQKFRPADGENGLPVLKIKELRQGFCDASSELCSPSIKPEYIVHDGDVIFSWSGSLLVDLWCGGTCGLNQHLFKVTSEKYPKWFYYIWTAHHLARFTAIAADKATTMGHIKREELAKAEVVIPDTASMERIGGIMQPIYDLIISNRIENRKLSTVRDTILPQLMSGEIDVSNIQL